jgi:glutamate synthase (NADPH/NADH) large chain/glutamate synthase (ferredoxin)
MTFILEGDANDYFGKGLSGGKISLFPPAGSTFAAEENMIIGNVALYGATAGEVFIRGMAGERFGVRNSGVKAVVEAIGDHGCEYMTGGTVAVLGKTGRNFGAGMSGGIAYVYDEDGEFASRCNTAMVSMEKVLTTAEQEVQVERKVWHRDQADEAQLKKLLEDHFKWTGSQRARELLDNWATARAKFVKVFPNEYKRALGEINARKAANAAKAAKPVAA